MTIHQYIDKLNQRFTTGVSTEHSYRGDLQALLEGLIPNYEITNEPRRSAVGAPDYIIRQESIARGYIEAKDVGKNLDDKLYKEQFTRYRNGLPNLIITNYHEFRLYQDGELKKTLHIAKLNESQTAFIPNESSYGEFKALISDFPQHVAQTIRSPKQLSKLMAAKTRLLKESFSRSLKEDIADAHNKDTALQNQYLSFKELLIKDIDPDLFADLYAQTIAYGMFAARSKDKTLENFDRREAAELIPKTNPFLRSLFQYIAGYDLDKRISWIIDGLADVFRATDVDGILHNFGKRTRMEDPIIHFYEDFLKEYNPKLRVERGVWYTPQPVVQFIVRAVDDVLKTDFNLKAGLADESKIDITYHAETKATADQRSKIKKVTGTKKVHRVQILDPATGTGTFLSEVVRKIHERFDGLEGLWPSYVDQHLIPRLNGFEILMASYAMAHLKLDLLLQELGYVKPQVSSPLERTEGEARFNIFLTNSLEPGIKEVPNLFMNEWLTTESQEASRVKTESPVMVVLGNPPYSGISSNKGDYIMNLMDAYKKEPGGKQKLRESNSKWINDDYVKFLRLSQHLVEKNEEGVVAFINPHGFLDNPTFRGMRWHLLKTFDKIYTIDLHGNTKKKEIAPDGSKDDNVFDIQQGVSINIFIKTGKKKKSDLGQVFHYDLYGKRKDKYAFLEKHSLKDIAFAKVPNVAPDYFMVPKDFKLMEEYQEAMGLIELFPINSLGIITKRDKLSIAYSDIELEEKLHNYLNPEISTELACANFNLVVKDKDKWDANLTRQNNYDDIIKGITKIRYRPFDDRSVIYHSDFVARLNPKVMSQFTFTNFGLLIGRQGMAVGDMQWNLSFISDSISDQNIYYRGGGTSFPIYLYDGNHRTPNLDRKLIQQFEAAIGLTFLPDHDIERIQEAIALRERGNDAYSGWELPETAQEISGLVSVEKPLGIFGYFTPLDVLDYIYAVLHSPKYREKYSEFLKTDFPRVPWPASPQSSPAERKQGTDSFWKLVELGGELRQFHLMKHKDSDHVKVTYPVAGDNVIRNKMTKTSPGWRENSNLNSKNENSDSNSSSSSSSSAALGKVWINEDQYFDNVPLAAWEFYIGGYQPAQKWLKDRKDRELTMEDIKHYRKIIKALNETGRLMNEVDEVIKLD
jgi:predicted helicase